MLLKSLSSPSHYTDQVSVVCSNSATLLKLWILLDVWLDALDGGSDCCKVTLRTYVPTTQKKRHISMHLVGFKLTIPVLE